ncbi:MAG: GAF domain-containing sensor histidine kinase [Ardenticatenaceae bacterium]|nr:GAF domain-containing sensor histidine kinase [Ardenticatenaceae bacterium]
MKPSFFQLFRQRFNNLVRLERLGVPEEQIVEALHKTQMDGLPFIYGSFAIMFFVYAAIQYYLLDETGQEVMVLVAVASGIFLLVAFVLLLRGFVPAKYAEGGTAVVASVILLTILLRFVYNPVPNQSANLALFLFGAGVMFTSLRWYLFMQIFCWLAWAAIFRQHPNHEEWLYFGVMIFVATFTGLVAHWVRLHALQQAEIYRFVERRQRRELVQRTVQQQTSFAVGQRITSILELDSLLDQIATLIWQRYEAYYVGVFLPNKNQLAIEAVAEAGGAVPEGGLKLKAGLKGLVGWVLANGRPLCIDDITRDFRYDPNEKAPNAQSEMLLPLKMGDKVLGVLDLQGDKTAAFLPNEIPNFQLLADQVAIALENAQLYAEIKRFNQQLEQKVAERTQALQGAYGQLERLDKTKTDFITIASHELRTPLTIVNFNAQMLLEDEAIQANAFFKKWTQGIERGVARMEEVVQSMLDVAKIDSSSLDLYLAPVDLLFLLRQIAKRFKQSLADRSIVLDLDGLERLPEIEGDVEALQKVFYQVLVNAIKYTPDGGRVMVNGRSQTTANGSEVEIIIADSGVGIAPELHELIFEKFYQTGEVMLHSSGKTSFKGGGAGLGLAIARGIVMAHNGRIWVESDGYDEDLLPGSRFHIVLPVKQPE